MAKGHWGVKKLFACPAVDDGSSRVIALVCRCDLRVGVSLQLCLCYFFVFLSHTLVSKLPDHIVEHSSLTILLLILDQEIAIRFFELIDPSTAFQDHFCVAW